MLADAPRQLPPERPEEEPGQEEPEQQNVGLARRHMFDLVEIEQIEDARDAGRPPQKQVHQDQPGDGGAEHQPEIVAHPAAAAAGPFVRFAYTPAGKGDGERQQANHEPAHGLHPGALAGMEAETQDRRQQQDEEDPQHIAGLPPAIDARAFIVVGR